MTSQSRSASHIPAGGISFLSDGELSISNLNCVMAGARANHECLEWLRSHEKVLVNGVIRKFASWAQIYNSEDDRFAMSRCFCAMLEKHFPSVWKREESKGYDMAFRTRNGKRVRVSVKIMQEFLGGESKKVGKGSTKPRVIVMANSRSEKSAGRIGSDEFDILLTVQRGPLESGLRKGRFITLFAVKENDDSLRRHYIFPSKKGKDPQRKLRLKRKEWGFVSSECEINPLPSEEIGAIRDEVLRLEIDRLEALFDAHEKGESR